ncbi:MAG: hypothetical protein K8F30_07775 [Taibaiella sp.]|nr:hypothetical protein [Taibaiella sp.]
MKLYLVNDKDVVVYEGNRNMTIHNTLGYELGLNYEYENKKHFTYSTFLDYGTQNHNASWKFDLTNFVPGITFSNPYQSHSEQWKTSYLHTSFMFGYNYAIPRHKRITIQGMIGLGVVSFFNSIRETGYYIWTYKDDANPNKIIAKPIMSYETEIGSDSYNGKFMSPRNFSDVNINPVYHIGLGVVYRTNSKYINAIRVGVRYTHIAEFKNGSGIDQIRVRYFDSNFDKIGSEILNNKFRSINLSIGFQF